MRQQRKMHKKFSNLGAAFKATDPVARELRSKKMFKRPVVAGQGLPELKRNL
jgi:hypothetical protein